jgi:hypothetical protein
MDRKLGSLHLGAIHAAMVCLAVDLRRERTLRDYRNFSPAITPLDCVAVTVGDDPFPTRYMDGVFVLDLPDGQRQRTKFLKGLKELRRMAFRTVEPPSIKKLRDFITSGLRTKPWEITQGEDDTTALMRASWFRWSVLADGVILEALERYLNSGLITPMDHSTITVLSLFSELPKLELRLNNGLSLRRGLAKYNVDLFTTYSQGSYGEDLDMKQMWLEAINWCNGVPGPLSRLVENFAQGNGESYVFN